MAYTVLFFRDTMGTAESQPCNAEAACKIRPGICAGSDLDTVQLRLQHVLLV